MRKGFSMLMALAVIVVVAVISALVFSLSGKMATGTEAKFRQEQAALLARSYAELAVLSVIDQNISANCITDINSTVDNIVPNGAAGAAGSGANYKVKIHISYLGNNLTTCPSADILNGSNPIATDYNTSSPQGLAAILIDVFVTYKDTGITPNSDITYHLRKLSKI